MVKYLKEWIHSFVLFLKRKSSGVDFSELDASWLEQSRLRDGSGVEGCGEDDPRFQIVNPLLHSLKGNVTMKIVME